jgi:hypothetical protein
MPPGVATNTLHVCLPPGKGLQAVSALLRRYGDVASINILPDEEQFAIAVVYFDIRAAALAHKALGASSRKAPQTGSRSVRVPGEVQLETKECEDISNVRYAEPEGAYILEFYDVRDATLFEAKVAESSSKATAKAEIATRANPTKLELPPGLEDHAMRQQIASEAAAVPSAQEKSIYRVVLEDLPVDILSEPMMQAMLQQAGLDKAVVNCSTHGSFPSKAGKKRNRGAGKASSLGSATLDFSSRHSAARCVHHFHGCQWDPSGAIVTAHLEALPVSSASSKQKSAAKVLSAEASVFRPALHKSDHLDASFQLSADAASFNPPRCGTSLPGHKVGARLSAAAPTFLPMSAKALASQFRDISDVSTEAGESSELEEDLRGLGVFIGSGSNLEVGSLLAGLARGGGRHGGKTLA